MFIATSPEADVSNLKFLITEISGKTGLNVLDEGITLHEIDTKYGNNIY